MDKALKALLALVVAILSVACAWLFFQSRWEITSIILGIGLLVGLACYFGGKQALPNQPVRAVKLMEGWILAPLMIAVLAGAAIIYIGVWLEPPENAPVDTEKLLAAASSALSVFLTTSFIDGVAEADTDWVGTPIRKAFEKAYHRTTGKRPLQPDSPAEHWVFSPDVGGVTGWGFKARRRRARELQALL
jgi:hypothetical protein